MPLQLDIPDTILEAIKLPGSRVKEGLMEELALALYADGALSFGKARQLADKGKREFAKLLGLHAISRHFSVDDLQDDLSYAGGQ
jgi:predicted HTH domain antitoxin